MAMCAARQQEILEEAARMLRPGGILVYSTCTFAPEEDEGSAAAFLSRHPEFSVEKVEGYEGFAPGRPEWAASGRGAGRAELADTFRLPSGYFTRGEYTAAINALTAMATQVSDEDTLSALEKLKHQQKSDKRDVSICGNILIDGGSWCDMGTFSEKMRVCEQAVNDCLSLDIDYISREGEHSRRIIDPYVLIFKQNIWYVYAYCHSRADFRTFKIGRIRKARFTGKSFEKKPISREDIPLNFGYSSEQLIPVTLEIKKEALADVEEWLGVDNIEPRGGGLVASVSLPDDDKLSRMSVSFTGVDRKIIVDLLDEKRDKVLRNYVIDSDATLDFPYLKEGRYCIRITEDANRNSFVDTGSVLERRQPERVLFYELDGDSYIDIPPSSELVQTINIAEMFK